ncbi:MAG: hypothetical protein WA667_02635 [Candidatus Nitrosopolaris sp.]
MLARGFSTVAQGRSICGLGIGWSKDEYQVSNVSYEKRGERADEYVQLLKRSESGQMMLKNSPLRFQFVALYAYC